MARKLLHLHEINSLTEDLLMNAIQLLKADHKRVRELLVELESTSKRASKKRR